MSDITGVPTQALLEDAAKHYLAGGARRAAIEQWRRRQVKAAQR